MPNRRPNLLVTESNRDFARRRKKLTEQIRPTGPIEDAYANELVHNDWELDRFRRIAAGIVNNNVVQAVGNLLKQLLPRQRFAAHLDRAQAAEELARHWPGDKTVRAEVANLLRECQLDESAIEAEAFRLSAADLESAYRIMAFKQARRDKDLCLLSEIRQGALACLQIPTESKVNDEVPQVIMVERRG
jgi:MoxR-like ATPase